MEPSKLFKLKKWLTVADAARHLSIAFGEPVTEADVLHLALNGRLRISVHFVNHAYARRGTVVGIEEVRGLPVHPTSKFGYLFEDKSGESINYFGAPHLGENRYLKLGDDVSTLTGIWDLPMFGGERLDIEHGYQNLTGGPAVTLTSRNGAFVERRGEGVYQLQESYEDSKFCPGSRAELVQLYQQIDADDITKDEAKWLLKLHKEARKELLAEKNTRPTREFYYPANGLPKDSTIVVLTEALREFEQSENDATTKSERPLGRTERTSLLIVIAALCKSSGIDLAAKGAAGKVAELTDKIGSSVSDETIRRMIKDIPEAKDSRTA